jgi:hypothetical protein
VLLRSTVDLLQILDGITNFNECIKYMIDSMKEFLRNIAL